MAYDLSKQPDEKIIYGFFARLMFMPLYFMNTFKEAFYTGFFTFDTKIFGPKVADIRARFVSYHAVERNYLLVTKPPTTQDEWMQKEYKEGLELLRQRPTLRRVHVRDDMS